MSNPTADHEGFTDSAGRRMSYENGLRNAARCIINQGETDAVEELLRDSQAPDEVLIWLVDPDTGEFADTFGVTS